MSRATLHLRTEDGMELPMLAWQFEQPMTVATTASCGGGLGMRDWVINAKVSHAYSRHDHDRYGAELAALLGLVGSGVVMLTAAEVRAVRSADVGGVQVEATVGLSHPSWAADTDSDAPYGVDPVAPGTINILAVVPVRLSDAALLNAMCTITEAKTQALLAAGVDASGTPSDAVTVACAARGAPEPFGGPRSRWGAPLARAVYQAVLAGASQ